MQAVKVFIEDTLDVFEIGDHNRRQSYQQPQEDYVKIETESHREECAESKYQALRVINAKNRRDLNLFQMIAVVEFLVIISMFVALAKMAM